MVFFDSNLSCGKHGLKHPREIWKLDDIENVMASCGISAALVFADEARDCEPQYGNDVLYERIKDNPCFYGCYTIMPGITGCFKSPNDVISDIKEKDMKAVRIFPKSHNYIPNEIVIGEYLIALEDASIPLFVDASEISWRDLGAILENHPKLNVVLLSADWSDAHNVFSYMKEYPNLHIDLSRFQMHYGIEVLVSKFGANRILFGSGLPKMSAGAARAFIDYAEISHEDKQKIAGGNLARLLNLPLPLEIPIDNDELAQCAAEGEPLDIYTFDSHAHFMQDGGNCGAGYAMVHGDMEGCLKMADRMGISDFAVAPWLGFWTDTEFGNLTVEEMAKRSDRIYPYALIDPNYVDVKETAEIYHSKKKFPGMKIFTSRCGCTFRDERFTPWYEIANKYHLFALMDSGGYGGYLEDIAYLAERYPNISFFIDHVGSSFAKADACVPLAKKYPNVYLQLTYTSVTQGMIEYLCEEGLADKVQYGTDVPMRDPRPQMGWVIYSTVSFEDKKKIMGGNMRKIADRCFK